MKMFVRKYYRDFLFLINYYLLLRNRKCESYKTKKKVQTSSNEASGKGHASVPLYFIYGFMVVMAYELVLNSKENPISGKTLLCKYMTCIILTHNVEYNKQY